MVGQAHFSQTELNGKCNQEIIEMLIQQKDIDWNKLKIYKQRGTCIIRSAHSSFLLNGKQITTDTWSHDFDIPRFIGEGRDYIERYLYPDDPNNTKGKRAALNLQHKDTIEFRMFKSTLKYETFILTLEFVKDIIDYAKSVDIEEIELAKWSDLMNCFSSELRKYYEFRYQKKVKDINGSTAKQIRKRISKLKSELKNSMNFFQKTKLQQEISNLEKVYKKLNKKEKEVAQAKQRAINFYNSI